MQAQTTGSSCIWPRLASIQTWLNQRRRTGTTSQRRGGVGVEDAGLGVGDVEGHDDDGGIGGAGAEGAELLEVGDEVAAGRW